MKNKSSKTRTIKVDYLARVEGEGALYIKIADGIVKDVNLKIFEAPRFFEALLQGRDFTEAPDITSRICGICPVAYLMSACHAMEDICKVQIPTELRNLRRLIYCGEWIKSHSLHIFMLNLPDLLGFDDAIGMAQQHPDVVKNGLRLKKIGNTLMELVGGRDIHPINVKVGGFYKAPTASELNDLVPELKKCLDLAINALDFFSKLNYFDYEEDYEFVALSHPEEYPFNEGDLISNKGLNFNISEFDKYFIEEHVPHSTALHTYLKDRGECFVGPLARYALNFEKLTPKAKKAAKKINILGQCNNPSKGILIRTIEVIFALEEALHIINSYKQAESCILVKPTAGVGYGCTEAPRGICFHKYEIDDSGNILYANIVPPTAINQKTIEKDIRNIVYNLVKTNPNIKDKELQSYSEQLIRSYDPCISCSTHFLDLTVDRQ